MRVTIKAACIAVVLIVCHPATAAASSNEAVFAAGMDAYERGLYADALASLTIAAHGGHRRAQEIAGLMNLFGAALYGSEVGTDRRAARRWFQLAASQGSEVGGKLAGISIEGSPSDGRTAGR